MHLENCVLVTGGTGFPGLHLCEKLLRDGAHVICVDNFETGTHANVESLREHPSFVLIRHDVCFPLHVECDEIFTSPVRLRRSTINAILCNHKDQRDGALNMLGLAKRLKAKILQAYTSEIYGDPSVHRLNDEIRDDVSVVRMHPWAMGNKDPRDLNFKVVLSSIVEEQCFCASLPSS